MLVVVWKHCIHVMVSKSTWNHFISLTSITKSWIGLSKHIICHDTDTTNLTGGGEGAGAASITAAAVRANHPLLHHLPSTVLKDQCVVDGSRE